MLMNLWGHSEATVWPGDSDGNAQYHIYNIESLAFAMESPGPRGKSLREKEGAPHDMSTSDDVVNSKGSREC